MMLMMNRQLRFSPLNDKKQLKQFYKQEHYSAGFKGFDIAYGAFDNEQLICALIISQLNPSNTQALLHGLVTKKSKQSQGYASKLLSYGLASYRKASLTHSTESPHNMGNTVESIVCFVEPKLRAFYQQHQFINQPITALNDTLRTRYIAYQKKQTDLLIMMYRD